MLDLKLLDSFLRRIAYKVNDFIRGMIRGCRQETDLLINCRMLRFRTASDKTDA